MRHCLWNRVIFASEQDFELVTVSLNLQIEIELETQHQTNHFTSIWFWTCSNLPVISFAVNVKICELTLS